MSFLDGTKSRQQKLLNAVSHKLSKEVMRNYEAFVHGMRQINAIDTDVLGAGIHVGNSLRKLDNAKRTLVHGTLAIAFQRRKRERLAMVRSQLTWVRSLYQLEGTIASACASRRYAEAVGFIVDAQMKVRADGGRGPAGAAGSSGGGTAGSSAGGHAFHLHLLRVLRPRVEGGLEALRGRVDRALDGLLLEFSSAGYGAVLLGYRELDEYGARSSAAAAAAAAAAAGTSPMGAAGGRGRAATAIAGGDGDDFALGLPGESSGPGGGGSGAGAGMDGPGSGTGAAAAGSSLLAEVGSSIAAAAAAANSGVLSIPNIGAADGNMAALPAAVQAAAVRAVLVLTKDAVIDQLLQAERARVDAEEKAEAAAAAAAAAEAARDVFGEGAAASGGAVPGSKPAGAGSAGRRDDDATGLRDDDSPAGAGASSPDADGVGGASSGSSSGGSGRRLGPAATEYAARLQELRQRSYADLCTIVPPAEVPEAARRVAAAIVRVMHSHYTLLQWHRLPFDPRNTHSSSSGPASAAGADQGTGAGAGAGAGSVGEDAPFLHRCAADDEEDAAEAEPGRGPTQHFAAARHAAVRPTGAPSVPGLRPSPLSDPATFISALNQMRRLLLRGRHAVWQHMQQRFATLLLSAIGIAGTSLPVERLSQCLIVARDLMAVGLEYVGFGTSASGSISASGNASAAGASKAAPGAAGNPFGAAAASGTTAADGSASASGSGSGSDMDPCSALRGSLRLLCSQYLDAVHGETFDRLRGLLAREVWQRVLGTEAAMAGVIDAAQGLRLRLNKGALAAISAATSAIRGSGDDGLGGGGGHAGAALTAGADGESGAGGGGGGSSDAAPGSAVRRCYSDGASVFAAWPERGNPFGWVNVGMHGRPGASSSGAGSGASLGVGVSVLTTPRRVPAGEDDDEYLDEEDEEEDDDGASSVASTGSGAKERSPLAGADASAAGAAAADADKERKEKERAAAAKRKAAAAARKTAAAARRALARHMSRVHGDSYRLELGLGRGPEMGVAALLAPADGGEGGAAGGAGGYSDDDDSSDDDDALVEHAGDSSDDDDDVDDSDDDAAASGAGRGSGSDEEGPGRPRRRRGGRRAARARAGDDGSLSAAAGLAEVVKVAFEGGHGHVATAAALNGVAKAVGRYLMLMDVLPTAAGDAFTGLARLFELYIYTVATIFVRGPALAALWRIETPAPTSVDPEASGSQGHAFEYLDGATLSTAARVASLAADARALDHRQAGFGLRGGSSRRFGPGALSSPGGSSAIGLGLGSDDEGSVGFGASGGGGGGAAASGGASSGRRPRAGERSEFETVELYGTTVYLRGLPALAQAQGLAPDHYGPSGPGASAGAVLAGNAVNAPGVFVFLRRALQLIGAELSASAGRAGARVSVSQSALADGALSYDTGNSTPGLQPPLFVIPATPLEMDSEAVAFGACERAVALESVDFLLDVLARARPRIEATLPPSSAPRVASFFSRAVLTAVQLRALLYQALLPKLLPLADLPDKISAVKWCVQPSTLRRCTVTRSSISLIALRMLRRSSTRQPVYGVPSCLPICTAADSECDCDSVFPSFHPSVFLSFFCLPFFLLGAGSRSAKPWSPTRTWRTLLACCPAQLACSTAASRAAPCRQCLASACGHPPLHT